ncbi:Short-chain dehydrogenase srdC [Paramyrothecium foliicola]|nr:Short-chain dehydrogenase srdC [Paramyrothecium foliicola]
MASLLSGSAFVTGAASGIGQAISLAFAKYGINKLAVADANGELLAETIASLKELYPNVEVLPIILDVRNSEQVKAGIAKTVETFGRLDIAVNNAGIPGTGQQTHETPEEEWLRVMDVNLNGVYRCQREEISYMLKQEDLGPRIGRGRIINIASVLGLVAAPPVFHQTSYSTSKHGVIGLTKSDANSYGKQGIRVNAVCPSYTKTKTMDQFLSQVSDTPMHAVIAGLPLSRLALLEEIADSVSLLASPMSSFMQGSCLVVDGGNSSN